MSAPVQPWEAFASRGGREIAAVGQVRRRRGRPTKDTSEDFARRLVLEATELFRTFGFHAASVGDIVEATGLTRPTLYRHFGSKAGLAVACVRADGLREAAELTAAAGGDGPALARLWAVADWHAERLCAADYRHPLALRALHDFPDEQHEIHRAARTSLRNRLVAIAPLLAGLDPAMASAAGEQLLMLMLGSGEVALAMERRAAADHFLAAAEDLLTRLQVRLADRTARPTGADHPQGSGPAATSLGG